MEIIDYAAIGNRVRAARKALNLTQEEASEKCDITSSFYGNIERGDKKMSVETLIKISRGLEISTDVLLFGEALDKQEALIELLTNIQQKASEKQFEKFLMLTKSMSTVIDKL